METSFLRMLVVFFGWTFTSIACHYCSKLFLKTASNMDGFNYHVIIITGLQIIFFLAFTQVLDVSETDATTTNKFVVFAAHACATLTTNWSMSVTHASSTFAIKLMEPLSSAILQRFLLDIRLSFLQWISIPAVVCGAILFTEDEKTSLSIVSNGVILAFVSNLCLSLRNVFMKKGHLSKTVYSINKSRLYLSVFALIVYTTLIYFLESVKMVLSETVYIYSLLLSSSLSHVGYTYISTIIVLKHFSVVGHAFGNILKRFSVLGFLYMTGSRIASIWNFIGLFICVTGLVVYTFSKTLPKPIKLKSASTLRVLCPGAVKNKLISVICILAGTGAMMSLAKSGTNGSYFDRNMNSVAYHDNLSSSKPLNFSIDDFFSLDLVQNPEETNKLSFLLTTRSDVIKEAQRIHQNIFKSLLGRYKYAMLFDYTPSENKGDSALSVGEFMLLRKLNINVVYACPIVCTEQNLNKAQNISRNYTDNELIILLQGGGNVLGWPFGDQGRSRVISRFMRFKIVMFPQSIFYNGPQHDDFCKKLYTTHPRLTFIWRDKRSYILGKNLFPNVRSLLSPDMAYQIGFVPRFMHPIYDILWLKREDSQTPGYLAPEAPIGLRMHVSDWLKWKTPRGTSRIEDTFLMTTNGMMFLQRGRIVVTDRLHGHILSTILDIPHVYIDNKQRKISNYHNTWTAGIENIILANSSLDAVEKARHLLIMLDKDLPQIKGFYTKMV